MVLGVGNHCLCCCNTGAEMISWFLPNRTGGDACVNNCRRRMLGQRDVISCGRLLKATGENDLQAALMKREIDSLTLNDWSYRFADTTAAHFWSWILMVASGAGRLSEMLHVFSRKMQLFLFWICFWVTRQMMNCRGFIFVRTLDGRKRVEIKRKKKKNR